MSWKNDLIPASYRGASFYIKRSDTSVGRQTKIYPANKTKPKIQDAGVDIDEFEIEGYVVQNLYNGYNYFSERDALIQALQTGATKEPTKTKSTEKYGTLKHPFYGELKVILLGKARITETFEEGGIARFVMTFARYREEFFGETVDHLSKVDDSVLTMTNGMLDDFTNMMDTAGAFLSTLTSPITQLMTNMQGAIASVSGAIGSTISTALGVISTGINLISSLLNTPCALANQIKDAADSALGLVGMAGDVVQGGIIGGCSGTERGETSTLTGESIPNELGKSIVKNSLTVSENDESDIDSVPTEQDDNIALIVNANKVMIVGVCMRIAIRIEYESQEEMETMTNLIADNLDDLLIRLGAQTGAQTGAQNFNNTLTYNSIEDARSDFVSSMIDKYSGLKKEVTYDVPTDVISVLELAYNKYDDITRDAEIFARNKTAIRHPGFLPNGNIIGILNE